MAIIDCPICGHEISTSDTKCIKCGSDKYTIQFELKKHELEAKGKIRKENTRRSRTIITIELLAIFAAVIAYFYFFMPRINGAIEDNKNKQNEKDCREDSGNWDNDLNKCIRKS